MVDIVLSISKVNTVTVLTIQRGLMYTRLHGAGGEGGHLISGVSGVWIFKRVHTVTQNIQALIRGFQCSIYLKCLLENLNQDACIWGCPCSRTSVHDLFEYKNKF